MFTTAFEIGETPTSENTRSHMFADFVELHVFCSRCKNLQTTLFDKNKPVDQPILRFGKVARYGDKYR